MKVYEATFPGGTQVRAILDEEGLPRSLFMMDCLDIQLDRKTQNPTDFIYYRSWILGIVAEAAKGFGRPFKWAFNKGNGNDRTEIWQCYPDGTREKITRQS